METDRSSSVLGSRPMRAMALGHHTEHALGFRSPAQRKTNAFDRVQSGIEDAAQFGAAAVCKNRVGFVDQECRGVLIDDARQGGWGAIGRLEWPPYETSENLEVAGFAASLFR